MRHRSFRRLTPALAIVLAGCAGTQLPPYGIREGELPPCADHRTCLSSHADEHEASRVDYLEYSQARREARSTLAAIVQGFPGARVVSSHRNYLRVEFTGTVARDGEDFFFEPQSVVDEVEFYFPPQRSIIHVRAAARAGPIDKAGARDRFAALQVLIEEYQERRGHSSLRL
ncbi:DUF1499 domain-containing protein [Natronospira bacteriovora]|uniref:DUF1499 domain-containing protein n=1 Tax=Natronospira bacteriovora TaxID=3069753 RepID=A0ABU0W565_9GAMM|nr:DUF1499 domain-containing protein [Natronospira sp. AB-CW4]MDQ2069157.1 DUF1499 domain-containing protein [Natronospira sp. AB-CW4]